MAGSKDLALHAPFLKSKQKTKGRRFNELQSNSSTLDISLFGHTTSWVNVCRMKRPVVVNVTGKLLCMHGDGREKLNHSWRFTW